MKETEFQQIISLIQKSDELQAREKDVQCQERSAERAYDKELRRLDREERKEEIKRLLDAVVKITKN